ncbi:type II toxin-antitoxin system RelE/ParE family toxin [bacterium]|nr:type II toxin-antitoxin system RelE/ParE family toxin [bacterium]MBU4510494.1 type II toxin-antitoxin system RelE/ParE family toxin [bacterium]
MDSYNIQWKKSAEKDLLIKSVESLIKNPFPKQCLKLHGTNKLYRIRIGDYRVIYQIDNTENALTIFYVRHRKDVYRKRK